MRGIHWHQSAASSISRNQSGKSSQSLETKQWYYSIRNCLQEQFLMFLVYIVQCALLFIILWLNIPPLVLKKWRYKNHCTWYEKPFLSQIRKWHTWMMMIIITSVILQLQECKFVVTFVIIIITCVISWSKKLSISCRHVTNDWQLFRLLRVDLT